ncbi:MAG TPA: hypothetical protein VGF81_06340 [Solirubrobacteraceae bacterium]|jgi:hypothetical protein
MLGPRCRGLSGELSVSPRRWQSRPCFWPDPGSAGAAVNTLTATSTDGAGAGATTSTSISVHYTG